MARKPPTKQRIAFGKMLRRRRKALGLSQAFVGRRVGVGPSVICRWESGDHAPELCWLKPLARVLDIGLVFLALRLIEAES